MTELIPALLDKVDDGSMGFTPAVQLSYLKKKEQQEIIDAMEATQCTPSLSQAIRIKKLSEAGKLTESEAEGILGEIKQKEADRVVFKNEQLYRSHTIAVESDEEALKDFWDYCEERQREERIIAEMKIKG